MMTGIQNVNSLEAGYYAATLIFIGWFALYDFRRHLVRNQALAIFFFWCLFVPAADRIDQPASCQSSDPAGCYGFSKRRTHLIGGSLDYPWRDWRR